MNRCKRMVVVLLTALSTADAFASSCGQKGESEDIQACHNLPIEEFKKQVSKSNEILWCNAGFGNRDYLFYSDGEKMGFQRLSQSDLSNDVKFPYGIENRLKSGNLKIQQYHQNGIWVFGNKEFAVIYDENGEKNLVSFSNNATLNDLYRFTERLYNTVVSSQIKSHEIPAAYRALVELCIQIALERINAACAMFAAGISYGRSLSWEDEVENKNTKLTAEETAAVVAIIAGAAIATWWGNSDRKLTFKMPKGFLKLYYAGECSPADLFAECALAPAPFIGEELFGWSSATKRIVSEVCVNQLVKAEDVNECAAYKYGRIFSVCNREYLKDLIRSIKGNGAVDIRKNNYEMSVVDLSFCETASDWWNDINQKEYLTVAAQLMKINREILVAVSEKPYNEGFEELKLLADRWRPTMRSHMRNYHYLFSDLPVVLTSHRAFAITYKADAFWSFNKDRASATGAAHQWARFCANGKVCHYLRSNYSSDIMVQYHGFLKKMLGEDKYKSLETTLKTSTDREKEEFPDKLPQ